MIPISRWSDIPEFPDETAEAHSTSARRGKAPARQEPLRIEQRHRVRLRRESQHFVFEFPPGRQVEIAERRPGKIRR